MFKEESNRIAWRSELLTELRDDVPATSGCILYRYMKCWKIYQRSVLITSLQIYVTHEELTPQHYGLI